MCLELESRSPHWAAFPSSLSDSQRWQLPVRVASSRNGNWPHCLSVCLSPCPSVFFFAFLHLLVYPNVSAGAGLKKKMQACGCWMRVCFASFCAGVNNAARIKWCEYSLAVYEWQIPVYLSLRLSGGYSVDNTHTRTRNSSKDCCVYCKPPLHCNVCPVCIHIFTPVHFDFTTDVLCLLEGGRVGSADLCIAPVPKSHHVGRIDSRLSPPCVYDLRLMPSWQSSQTLL